MKKWIVCALIVIAMLVCLPLPKRVTQTLYGTNLDDGEKGTISMDVKYFRFLLLKDKMYGKITVTSGSETTVYGEHLSYSLYPTNNEDETMHVLSGFWYDGEYNTMNPVSVYISREFDQILIRADHTDGLRQYVGNIEENKEKETAAYFAGFYEVENQTDETTVA